MEDGHYTTLKGPSRNVHNEINIIISYLGLLWFASCIRRHYATSALAQGINPKLCVIRQSHIGPDGLDLSLALISLREVVSNYALLGYTSDSPVLWGIVMRTKSPSSWQIRRQIWLALLLRLSNVLSLASISKVPAPNRLVSSWCSFILSRYRSEIFCFIMISFP